MAVIERYATLLVAENGRQNLIARSTEATIWTRHLLDSLQLARFAREGDRDWIDVGSGPGLPGLVLAALGRWEMVLVEPRKRRVEFLQQTVAHLGLANVSIVATDIAQVRKRADVVSARAVASVDRLLALTGGCSDGSTRFVLPKGRSAREDMDLARARWQGLFHVEQSITDPDAGIVIADRVRRR
jgi:16S rRNA (guanine527-N7)-methyltransferase